MSDVEVISAAAKGIANGILQDKKSTITWIGILGFIFVVGVVGFGLDRILYQKNVATTTTTKTAEEDDDDDAEGTATTDKSSTKASHHEKKDKET